MTRSQAEALAAFLVTLRPGQRAWTKTACLDALTTAAADHTADTETLTRAALRAALSAVVATPSIIAMPGEHWEAASYGPGALKPPDTRCPKCRDHHPHDPTCPPPPARDVAEYAAAARRNIRPMWTPKPAKENP